jgi:hypothetical protein
MAVRRVPCSCERICYEGMNVGTATNPRFESPGGQKKKSSRGSALPRRAEKKKLKGECTPQEGRKKKAQGGVQLKKKLKGECNLKKRAQGGSARKKGVLKGLEVTNPS